MKNSTSYLILAAICWGLSMMILFTDGSDVVWGVSLIMAVVYLSTFSILKTIEDKDETV